MIESEPEQIEIPWTPFTKELSRSKVSLVTTAGISMTSDHPFDMETEKKEGDWGDPSWRYIKHGTKSHQLAINHLHIDTRYMERDINVALPIDVIDKLENEGKIGSVASYHYSIMGYQGKDITELANISSPAIAKAMKKDNVDIAILAPV